MIDENQMRRRVELSQQFIEQAENYGMDFLYRIVTVDETWIQKLNRNHLCGKRQDHHPQRNSKCADQLRKECSLSSLM